MAYAMLCVAVALEPTKCTVSTLVQTCWKSPFAAVTEVIELNVYGIWAYDRSVYLDL